MPFNGYLGGPGRGWGVHHERTSLLRFIGVGASKFTVQGFRAKGFLGIRGARVRGFRGLGCRLHPEFLGPLE